MDRAEGAPTGAIADPASLELEEWHRFVHLLLLLVQSGRLDASDAIDLVEELGHPPNIERGRSALFEIARRHEPDVCAS